MTAPTGPASLQAPALFDRSIDETEVLGFRLPPDVTDLLTNAQGLALIAWPVQDPTILHCEYIDQLDQNGNRTFLPGIFHYRHWSNVLNSELARSNLERWYPGWRRFPTVMGNLWTPLDDFFGGEVGDGDEIITRIWDLAPITKDQATTYLDRSAEALDAGGFSELMAWGEINHSHDGNPEFYETSAAQVFAELTLQLFHVEPGTQFPTDLDDPTTPFPDIGGPLPGVAEYPLTLPMAEDRLWRMLCARTRINRAVFDSWAAHQPEASTVRSQERRFHLWD